MPPEAAIEIDAQYRQLREECGLLEVPRGMLDVSGPEGAEYLQGQLTNDVEALEPGEGCYAALLDRKGHMQADMRVLRPERDMIRLDTEPQAREAVLRHLRTYKIGREVEVEDRSEDRALISLVGPRSAEVAGTPPLPEHSCRAVAIGGADALAAGTNVGVDLLVASADRERIREALLARGAGAVAPDAAEILRVEAGIPRFGAEMGARTMPAEAGIVERAVSFTKGCYIGQETVARLHYKGRPNRHLRGLRLERPVDAGTVLTLGGREVGRVGTACVSPAFGPIGLAIVRREAEPGTELSAGEDAVTCRVVDLPFR